MFLKFTNRIHPIGKGRISLLKHRFFSFLLLLMLAAALTTIAAAVPDGGDGSSADAPLTVPEAGYAHSGGAISGIDAAWLAAQKEALGLAADSDAKMCIRDRLNTVAAKKPAVPTSTPVPTL